MDEDYTFIASDFACGICMALDGTNCSTLPHPNCLCQIVPQEKECHAEYTFSGNYDGPGSYDGSVGGEITVFCPDGSEISESFEFDLGPYESTGDDTLDIAIEEFEAEAAALCEQCPEPEPFLCC